MSYRAQSWNKNRFLPLDEFRTEYRNCPKTGTPLKITQQRHISTDKKGKVWLDIESEVLHESIDPIPLADL